MNATEPYKDTDYINATDITDFTMVTVPNGGEILGLGAGDSVIIGVINHCLLTMLTDITDHGTMTDLITFLSQKNTYLSRFLKPFMTNCKRQNVDLSLQ